MFQYIEILLSTVTTYSSDNLYLCINPTNKSPSHTEYRLHSPPSTALASSLAVNSISSSLFSSSSASGSRASASLPAHQWRRQRWDWCYDGCVYVLQSKVRCNENTPRSIPYKMMRQRWKIPIRFGLWHTSDCLLE